ncbi:MAG: hypothetical protein JWM14_1020 [Chitinophagaceae bacterium]|nr:hypothetical protein [Chitinophagaceae bacterium]
MVYNDLAEEVVLLSASSSQGINSTEAVLFLDVITKDHAPTKQDIGNVQAYINGRLANTRIEDASTVTAINNSAGETLLLAYPNPFHNSLFLQLPNSLPEGSKLTLYDLNGKECESMVNIKAGETIEMGALLRSGLYIAELETPQGKERLKIIKQ